VEGQGVAVVAAAARRTPRRRASGKIFIDITWTSSCPDQRIKTCVALPPADGLTYRHPLHMVFHMKTTLNIDETVMAQLKREAARQGRTMSELVETALRNLFRAQKEAAALPALPVFHSGGAFADIADRDALYQAMEGR
jgi:hypothetical protein